jgi:hypothetical protein
MTAAAPHPSTPPRCHVRPVECRMTPIPLPDRDTTA